MIHRININQPRFRTEYGRVGLWIVGKFRYGKELKVRTRPLLLFPP